MHVRQFSFGTTSGFDKLICSQLALAVFFCASATAQADLVTTFDFNDTSMWMVSVSTAGNMTDSGSGVVGSGATLAIDGSGIGSILLTATLIGAINTAGFTDLTLSFANNTTAGGLEFHTLQFGGQVGDGFAISSDHGISFDTGIADDTFEAVLDGGATWDATTAAVYGQDLAFDASVNNGMITDLDIRMQVDVASEEFELSAFQVSGTVAAVPEPTAFAFGGLVCTLAALTYVGGKLRKKRAAAREV
jgi:hypothetical protein